MAVLTLHEDYTREEVHGIFSPETTFTPQAGTWGLQGIVPVPDRPNDYVLFVTFGQEQGDHEFDEYITESGVLGWQSQPRQHHDSPTVQRFIHHDELTGSIHLFLRTNRSPMPYTYLGTLKYLDHDTQRSRPVYFQWQLNQWPVPPPVRTRMGLQLGEIEAEVVSNGLTLVDPPPTHGSGGSPTRSFKARKGNDRTATDARNRALGLAGEEAVVNAEVKLLKDAGRADLAANVRHVAKEEGDGAGYDVLSFATDGSPKHIEVKATRYGAGAAFYITSNEVAYSQTHPESYHLYRLFNFKNGNGQYWELTGDVSAQLDLSPTEYRARLVNDHGN